jgi:hypothetical protein
MKKPTPPNRVACTCGSTAFSLDETINHGAEIIDGKLVVTERDQGNEASSIVCDSCGDDFHLAEFDSSELF